MPTSITQSTAAADQATRGRKIIRFAPYALSPVLLLVALLGPGWLFVPANPAIKAPATTLGFHDLHKLAASGVIPTTWIQQNYFGWLGWTLVLIIIAACLATAITGHRLAAAMLSAAGFVSLVTHLFAVKGALTWSQFADQTPNLRVGAYCAVAAYLFAFAAGVLRVRR